MEKMPCRDERDKDRNVTTRIVATPETQLASVTTADIVGSDWRSGLPVLSGEQVVLRELRISDAPSLVALLATDEVSRFISPPPATIDGFERFIGWTFGQRAAGTYACFAVTLKGFDTAIGIFQVRETDPGFATAQWGFALGSPFWGTGVFQEGAELVLAFVFDTLRVHRLEARVAVPNGRGHGALLKIGAVREGVLRKSFQRNGRSFDQGLYAIVDDDYRASRNIAWPTVPARVH